MASWVVERNALIRDLDRSLQRKSPNPNPIPVSGDRRSFEQCRLTLDADGCDQLCLLFRAQPLDPQQDYGRVALSCDGQVGVKVVIQRHANPAGLTRGLQNLGILGIRYSHLTHVDSRDSTRSEQACRTGSQPLVQQDGNHATRSIPRLSSSTLGLRTAGLGSSPRVREMDTRQ